MRYFIIYYCPASNQAQMATAQSSLSNSVNNSAVQTQTIRIKKDANGSFGFSILGGVDKEHIPNCPEIFITRVRRPDLRTLVSSGDAILEVNNKSLAGKTHEEVVQILRDIKDECEMLIEKNAEERILMDQPSAEDLNSNNEVDTITQSTASSLHWPGGEGSSIATNNLDEDNNTTAGTTDSVGDNRTTTSDRDLCTVETSNGMTINNMTDSLMSRVVDIVFYGAGTIALMAVVIVGLRGMTRI